jgi:hypothetical protein
MTNYLTKLAIVTACMAFVTVSAGVHAGTKYFDLIVQTTFATLFDVAGNPVPISSAGRVGDVFFSDRLIFEADTSVEPPTAVGPALGRSLIECRVIAAATTSAAPGVLCRASFAFNDRGFMTASGPVDLTAPENSGAITGGAGDFSGVTGDFVARPVSATDTLYRIRLHAPPEGEPLF